MTDFLEEMIIKRHKAAAERAKMELDKRKEGWIHRSKSLLCSSGGGKIKSHRTNLT